MIHSPNSRAVQHCRLQLPRNELTCAQFLKARFGGARRVQVEHSRLPYPIFENPATRAQSRHGAGEQYLDARSAAIKSPLELHDRITRTVLAMANGVGHRQDWETNCRTP